MAAIGMKGLVQVTQSPMGPVVGEETMSNLPFESEVSKGALISGMIATEFQEAKTERLMRHDKKIVRAIQHNRAEYGSEWNFTDTQSNLFLPRPQERVRAALGKLLEFIDPVQGESWDMEFTKNPEGDIDPKEMEGRRDRAKKEIKDITDDGDYSGVIFDGAWECVVGGTFICRAPMLEAAQQTRRGVTTSEKRKIKCLDPLEVYEDPFARDKKSCSYIIVRHVLTEGELRGLGGQTGFDEEVIEDLIERFPDGNYVAEWWETELGIGKRQNRYVVFERWGYLSNVYQRAWFGKDHKHDPKIWEIWSCDNETLKLSSNAFYELELPFYFVPLEKMDHSMRGRGIPEMMAPITEFQGSLIRAMHDNMGWSAFPQTIIDHSQIVPGQDLTPAARKVWSAMPNEMSGGRKPVDFFTVPSNAQELMSVLQAMDALIPLVTSIPMTEDPREAGSGMRTIGQQQMYYALAVLFIKIMVRNWDQYFFKPLITDLYDDVYQRVPEAQGDFKIVPMGVKGALRRELLGMKAMEIQQVLANPAFEQLANTPMIMKLILEGYFGIDGDKIVLPPEEVAARMEVQAKHDAAADKMKAEGDIKVRAETSRRDGLLQLAKNVQDTNPAWAAAQRIAYGAMGAMTQELDAGLNLHAERMATEMLQITGDQKNVDALTKSPSPLNAMEWDPDVRALIFGQGAPGGLPPEVQEGATGPGGPPVAPVPEAPAPVAAPEPVAPPAVHLHLPPTPEKKKTKKKVSTKRNEAGDLEAMIEEVDA